MKKACVIGWPIKHSRSPLIHNYWIKHHNIDAIYERRAVEPKDLSQFLHNLANEGYAGCNVTIPHKEAALNFVNEYDERVTKTGSLNTIYLKDGKIYATSTDGEGFLNNIYANAPNFQFNDKKILMIGAGGSARAICERLLHQNVQSIFVLNRNQIRIQELQNIFGKKIQAFHDYELENHLKQSDMLVNTTSQGMVGQPDFQIDLSHLQKHAVVADIVYVPLKTNLILQAEALGLVAVPGLGMLLHQAVEGFSYWFGVRPTVTKELHNLIAHDILAEQAE